MYFTEVYYARKWIHHPFNDYMSKSNFTPNQFQGTSGLSYYGVLLFNEVILSSCGVLLSWWNVIFFHCVMCNCKYVVCICHAVKCFYFHYAFWYHYGMYATIYLKCFCYNAVWLVTSHNSKNIDMTLWQDIPAGVRL